MKPRELSELAVLEYYDGPILFTAEDAAESKYICVFLKNQKREGSSCVLGLRRPLFGVFWLVELT